MNKISIKNKIVAIILSVSMIVSLVPSFSLTFTAETGTEAPVCTCGTENDTHAVDCALYVAPTSTVCTTCQQTPCVCCEVCKNSPCTCDPAPTDPVQLVNTDETKPCTCTPVDGVHQADCASLCTCDPVDGVHLEGCALYVKPEPEKCEYCNVELIENAVHLDNCLTFCSCEPKPIGEEAHTNTECKFYAPVDSVDESSDISSEQGETPPETRYGKVTSSFPILWKDPTNTQDQVGAQPSLLPEIVVILETYVFSETTTLYKIDAADGYTWPEEYNGYHYINSSLVQEIEYIPNDEPGSDDSTDASVDAYGNPVCDCSSTETNYANHTDGCARKTFILSLFNGKSAEEISSSWDSYDSGLQSEILDVIRVYDQTKYEELSALVGGSSGSEDPDEPTVDENGFPLCSCGNTSENLAEHGTECARYSYICDTYAKEKTAQEIYADWSKLDVATQNAILSCLASTYPEKQAELIDLINGSSGSEDDDDAPVDISYPAQIADNVTVSATAPFGTFPDGTAFSVSHVTEGLDSISAAVTNAINTYLSDLTVQQLAMKVLDISFIHENVKIQPQNSVLLNLNIPASDIVPGADTIMIFHIASSGMVELKTIRGIDLGVDFSVAVPADSFSHYVILQGSTTYNSTLMRDKLKGNDRFSIVTFPVTLNDFDAVKYNDHYGNSGLWFTGGDGGQGMNLGSAAATQGIVQSTLKNGYPVTYGSDRGYILFGPDAAEGKTPHSNIPFEFIYDKNTGYYTYNSGANHAQYNSSTNRVELYADTLAPYNYLTSVYDRITVSSSATLSNGNGYKQITVTKASTDYMFNAVNIDFPEDDKYDNSSNYFNYFNIRLYSNHSGVINAEIVFSDGNTQPISLNLQKDTWADYTFGPIQANKKISGVRIKLPNATVNDYVRVSSIGFLNTGNKNGVNDAGLYPFSDISKSYAGNEKFSDSTWQDLVVSGNNAHIKSSRVIHDYSSGSSGDLNDKYAYYAMAMEFQFYLPVGRTVNGDDIIFNFTGDDDMWVFVDNELALDIGGLHIAVDGEINFTTGATEVSNARQLIDADSTTASVKPKGGSLNSKQLEPGYHTIKIFYMERAGTNSNCMIKFNLPLVPTGSVLVEKTVTETFAGANVALDETIKNEEFTFTISAKNTSNAVVDLSNFDFYVIASDKTTVTEKKTSANSTFTLKHGEKAVFEIDESITVTVTETAKNIDGYKYISTIPSISSTQTTVANQTKTFSFTNSYDKIYYQYQLHFDHNHTDMDIDQTLYAIDNNNWSDGIVDYTKTTYTFDMPQTLPTRDGYIFLGWATTADATVPDFTNENVMTGKPNELVEDTLYAVWMQTSILRVEKQVVVAGTSEDTPDPDKLFDFTISLDTTVVGSPTSFSYTIYNSDNTEASTVRFDDIESETTSEAAIDATFQLKAGQYALFTLVGGVNVTVTEQAIEGADAEYWTTAESVKTETTVSGEQTTVTFVNTYNKITMVDLTITKTGLSAYDISIDPNQSFIFHVEGPDGLVYDVTIIGNSSVTLKSVPKGQYTVTEDLAWSWRYSLSGVSYAEGKDPKDITPILEGSILKGCTIDVQADGNVTFTNNRSDIYWLDGNAHAINVFPNVSSGS